MAAKEAVSGEGRVMKGVVFTEFLDMVDSHFGEETTDAVLTGCPIASGGAYTAVGTYDAAELHVLIGRLSERTATSREALQRSYGERLFSRFVELYPALFREAADPLAFLISIEEEIHVEVAKLYPDAELPSLKAVRRGDDGLQMRYRSRNDLPAFCEGLIAGCLAHFGAKGNIVRKDGEDEKGAFTDFDVTLL